MQIRSLGTIALLSLIAIAAPPLLGCGDLAHTNPVDPESSMTITIDGPTEIHSIGQQVDYTYSSTPEWTFGAAVWSSSAPAVLALAAGGGRMVSTGNGDAMVTLSLGPHTAEVHVTVAQVAAGVTVRACTGQPARIPFVGGKLPLCAFVHDSLGSRVAGEEVSLSSDDSSIVELQDTTAVARATGETFVRASSGSWRDSLLVQVGS
jgi:hypothetical protein